MKISKARIDAIWSAFDDLLDDYNESRIYVEGYNQIIQMIIDEEKYTGPELQFFSKNWYIQELIDELVKGIEGDKEMIEAYGYSQKEFMELLSMVKSAISMFPGEYNFKPRFKS